MLRWMMSVALAAVPVVAPVHPIPIEPRVEQAQTLGSWSGLASWYGGGEPLNTHVAMGHRFDPEALEAAMWDVPFGSTIEVTNLENGRSIVVRITDRGPAHRFGDRVIDLTRGSFARLAPLERGLIPVHLKRLS